MKVWIVSAKVEEIQVRSVDKICDSKEKADKYAKEQQKNEILLPSLGGYEHIIEE
jgi:hypothetical protein